MTGGSVATIVAGEAVVDHAQLTDVGPGQTGARKRRGAVGSRPVLWQLDPDLLQPVTSVRSRAAPTPAKRDADQTLRNNGESGLAAIDATLPERREVERVDHFGASSYLNIRECLRPLHIEHSEQR